MAVHNINLAPVGSIRWVRLDGFGREVSMNAGMRGDRVLLSQRNALQSFPEASGASTRRFAKNGTVSTLRNTQYSISLSGPFSS